MHGIERRRRIEGSEARGSRRGLWAVWLFLVCIGGMLLAPACSGINAGVGEPNPFVAPSSPKELVAFGFTAGANPGLKADVVATVSGDSVTATVPFGTDVRALRPTFRHTGERIVVGGVAQESGVTPNDFTNSVPYVVIAADGSERSYGVTVSVASSSAQELTAFSFFKVDNAQLSAGVAGTITGSTITLSVPFGTDVKALKAAFQTTGNAVSVNGVVQESRVTPNDFSSPVTYVVNAADGSKRSYTVTVTAASAMSKDITQFAFLSAFNATLPSDVTAQISGSQIAATLPTGTDVTALVASFEATAGEVSVAGVPQVSGVGEA